MASSLAISASALAQSRWRNGAMAQWRWAISVRISAIRTATSGFPAERGADQQSAKKKKRSSGMGSIIEGYPIYVTTIHFHDPGVKMLPDFPLSITCQFLAKSWSETPFHEMDGAGNLSRASISNALSGGIDGEGTLEYLLAYPAITGGDVAFIGYERILARIGSWEGSVTIKHEGIFSPTSGVNGTLEVVAGSGTNDFSGISGSGVITAKPGEHGGEYYFTLEKIVL